MIKMDKLPHDWNIVMGDFATKVQKYTGGSLGWIARQRDTEDYFGFVLGERAGFISLAEARVADDEVVRRVAGEMLGYPVDSLQDLERRKDETRKQIDIVRKQLSVLESRHQQLLELEIELLYKLSFFANQE